MLLLVLFISTPETILDVPSSKFKSRDLGKKKKNHLHHGHHIYTIIVITYSLMISSVGLYKYIIKLICKSLTKENLSNQLNTGGSFTNQHFSRSVFGGCSYYVLIKIETLRSLKTFDFLHNQ